MYIEAIREIGSVCPDGFEDKAGNFVVRFSKKFQQTIRLASRDGSRPAPTGKVNFVVYWQVEDGVEVRVVLPEVTFLLDSK